MDFYLAGYIKFSITQTGRFIRKEITVNNRVVNFIGYVSDDYRELSATALILFCLFKEKTNTSSTEPIPGLLATEINPPCTANHQ